MKRSVERDQEPPTKHVQSITYLSLVDDEIYEICKWLPSRFLVTTCRLVSRKWKSIIKNIKLELEMHPAEWAAFCSGDKEISSDIVSLTIKVRYRTMFSIVRNINDLTGFGRLTQLSNLSFEGCALRGSFAEDIVKNTKVVNLRFRECLTSWKDMKPLGHTHRQISVTIEKCSVIENSRDGLDESSDIKPGFLRFDSIQLSTRGSNDGVLFQALSDANCTCKISTEISATSMRYLPLMNSLTCLGVASHESGDSIIEESKLQAFKNLENLKRIEYFVEPDSIHRGFLKILLHRPDNINHLAIEEYDSLTKDEIKLLPTLTNLNTLMIRCYTGGIVPFQWTNLTSLCLIDGVLREQEAASIKKIHSLKDVKISDLMIEIESLDKDPLSAQAPEFRPFTFADLCDCIDGIPKCNLARLTDVHVLYPLYGSNTLSVLPEMSNLRVLHLLKSNEEMLQSNEELTPSTNDYTEETKELSTAQLEYISRTPSLTHLKLMVDLISVAGIQHISRMKQLEHLSLSVGELTKEHIDHISRMENLEEIFFSNASLNIEGLVQISSMKNLRSFGFSYDDTLDSVITILKSMPRLRFLRFSHIHAASNRFLNKLKEIESIYEFDIRRDIHQ